MADKKTNLYLSLPLLLIIPILLSITLYHLDDFDAAPISPDYPQNAITVPRHYNRVSYENEKIGQKVLVGPEDLAYDEEERAIYTGCMDGWIKRVKIGDRSMPAVENWTFVGGRPLGVAFGPGRRLYVANAEKGLMVVERDGEVKLLVDEAEGIKFGLTDAVEVSSDGMVYFTDASYKYSLKDHMLDIMEARPYGRLLRFDPNTTRTEVLVRDLYFANGVALSPEQDILIFCETLMRRCRRYHIRGDRSGEVDNFIDKIPGFPDNIRYDGNGSYWIGMPSEETEMLRLAFKYPILRKVMVMIDKFVKTPNSLRNGGVLEVNLEGHAVSLYTDPTFHGITGGLKIGNHLYIGNLIEPHMSRLDLASLGPQTM